MNPVQRLLLLSFLTCVCSINSALAQSIAVSPSPDGSIARVYFDRDFCSSFHFDPASLQVAGKSISVDFGIGSSQCGDEAPGRGPFFLALPALAPGDYQLTVSILGFSPALPAVVFNFTISAAIASAPTPLPANDVSALATLFLGVLVIAHTAMKKGAPIGAIRNVTHG
jgi:hypothetical protein